MDIALMMGEVGFISHIDIINGILANAYNDNAKIFLFTCEGWKYEKNSEYELGEYSIFNLPDLSRFSGVIVDIDTIRNRKACETILQKIAISGIPSVSINIPLGLRKSSTIKLENTSGIQNMVEHLIDKHGVSDIHFISGPLHNRDARERKNAFLGKMKERNIEIAEENISYGDFTYQSGRNIIREYIHTKRHLPGAFMAANDQMAIGAIQELQNNGYIIPKDIIVTGYDACGMSKYVKPSLTTIKRDEYHAGIAAYENVKRLINGEEAGKDQIIYGTNIYSESCGCELKTPGLGSSSVMELIGRNIYMEQCLETLKLNSIDFSNMTSLSDLQTYIQNTVEQILVNYFYVCLCGTKESYYEDVERLSVGLGVDRNMDMYTQYGYVPYAYEMGQWGSYDSFELSKLLPDECRMNRNGSYYIVLPLHYGKLCLGYCVIAPQNPRKEQRLIQHLVLNIGNAIGNIREYDIMHSMLAKMSEIWIHDELTNIYNRAGFWQKVKGFVAKTKENDGKIVIFFMDLDGLKKINDEYGHDEGDLYIKSMAQILKSCNTGSGVISRYGGDEFVVLENYDTDDDIKLYLDRLKNEVENFNKAEMFAHKLSVSIGYQREDDFETLDIRKMIEKADKEMYNCKRNKLKN